MVSPKKSGVGMHVALLRAINVGGNNKLPMKDLVALFEKAGCAKVSTYIQSGNVVFQADAGLAASVPQVLAKAILKSHGIQVPVIVRSAAQMAKAAATHPLMQAGAPEKMLHVGFLAHAPGAAQLAALDPQRSPGDVFQVVGSEIYIRFADGAGKTKLTNQYFDSKLNNVLTLRNWNTVRTLADLAASPAKN